MLGDEDEAKKYLTIIRNRAFPEGQARVDDFIASEGSLLEAVIDERGFEFAGEGDRRQVLIRTGLIGKKIKAIKTLTKQMMDGLEANGYYRF
ncbi:MAG: RagB/SusD family nutrient uptake outer membrane protein [Prevotella sp.]|nr:RagB/SusD family nutrient uptake outer membrane protein [Prevotella sp.]